MYDKDPENPLLRRFGIWSSRPNRVSGSRSPDASCWF